MEQWASAQEPKCCEPEHDWLSTYMARYGDDLGVIAYCAHCGVNRFMVICFHEVDIVDDVGVDEEGIQSINYWPEYEYE